MVAARWPRSRALGPRDPLAFDELDGTGLLVLDDVTGSDDDQLDWCRGAPVPVVAASPAGSRPPSVVDVALVGDEVEELPRLVAAVETNPAAARVLVDVLRVGSGLDVAAGLVVESLAYTGLLAGPEFGEWLARQPKRMPRSFSEAPVKITRSDDRLRITLARPENHNAFSAEMRDSLFEALSLAIVDDTSGGVLLDAEGPVFSSGGDLTEFGSSTDVVRAHQIRTLHSVGGLIARLGSRVTVLAKGPCVGAGVELGAFAGRVIADEGASFRLPEVAMGLIPGAGGTVSVRRRIGRQATARLALLGDTVDARDALALGLIDEIGAAPPA